MAGGGAGAHQPLPAGDFATWLREMQQALRGERSADVPCGDCTACCTASQFVHIGPDEADTIARIPAALLFPAPRMPRGHLLLGYDERGHCPMLVDGACSIYEHRPRTCRTYDCRIFAATGISPDDGGVDTEKVQIAERVARWQFAYPTARDSDLHTAVQASAVAAQADDGRRPPGAPPHTAIQLAVRAVELCEDEAESREL